MESQDAKPDKRHHVAAETSGVSYSNNKYYNKTSGSKDSLKSSGSKKLFNPLLMNSCTDQPKLSSQSAMSINLGYSNRNSEEFTPLNLPKRMELPNRKYSSTAESESRDTRTSRDYDKSLSQSFEENSPAASWNQSTSKNTENLQKTDHSFRYHNKNDVSPRNQKDYRSSNSYQTDTYQQFRNRKSSEYQVGPNRRQYNYENDNFSNRNNYGYSNKNESNDNEYIPSQNNSFNKSPMIKRANVDYEYDIDRMESISKKIIFDSHCHLDRIFDTWNKDKLGLSKDKWRGNNNPPDCQPLDYLKTQEQFNNAFGSKFEGCISVCCDPPTWTKTWYDWLRQEDEVWLTYGCHPAKAALFNESADNTLQLLLSFPKVVALGETGLDETYYDRNGATKEVQVQAFKRHIEIAKRMKKAIVIHLRGEVQELAKQILLDSGLPKEWKIHMHCFNQNLEVAEEWLKDWPNMKFGVVPNFYDRDVGKHLPLKHLLLETDAPYFIPKKLKEAENAPKMGIPGHVFHTAAQLAALRDIPIEDIFYSNRKNIADVYGIPLADDEPPLDGKSIPGDQESIAADTFGEKKEVKNKSEEVSTDFDSKEVILNEYPSCEKNQIKMSNLSILEKNAMDDEKVLSPCVKLEKRPREADPSFLNEDYGTYFKESKKPKLEVVAEVRKTHSEQIGYKPVWAEIREKVKEHVVDLIIKNLFEDPQNINRETKPNKYEAAKEQIQTLHSNLIKSHESQPRDYNGTQVSTLNPSINDQIKQEKVAWEETSIKKENSCKDNQTVSCNGIKVEEKDFETSGRDSNQEFKIPKLPCKYPNEKFTIPKRNHQNTCNAEGDCGLNKPHKHNEKQQSTDAEKSKKKEKGKTDETKLRKQFELWFENKKNKKKYTGMEVMDLYFSWKEKHGRKEHSYREEKKSNGSKGKDKDSNDKSVKHRREDVDHKSTRSDDDHHTLSEKLSIKSKDKLKKEKDTPKERRKLK